VFRRWQSRRILLGVATAVATALRLHCGGTSVAGAAGENLDPTFGTVSNY
jgi:hypothetical protein